ncbi:UbiX family flavin prenyltransferase [Bartonella sp. HY406]|uniref:UbiX family flavin prenyltransferase n=1 Tax=Bartonella sp. HY406 TaxID=2979331 RepID=UPI0021C5CB7F|nr:UbiX family flavin prenyltransferase [Bartonella sp. HY406]UXN04136.1 UbiX family flavin prenyltransferase [Bartonella sp. HY406]
MMNEPQNIRIVVAITGASGAAIGLKIIDYLHAEKHIDLHVVISPSAQRTIETEVSKENLQKYKQLQTNFMSNIIFHDYHNIGASIASGSFKTAAMIIAPCSMHSLAAIANGLADNLIIRAADVHLKERRRLILLARETPLHLGHLRNMVQVTEMGGIIMPPVPAFYHKPQTIDDIVNDLALRAISLTNISISAKAKEWFDE